MNLIFDNGPAKMRATVFDYNIRPILLMSKIGDFAYDICSGK